MNAPAGTFEKLIWELGRSLEPLADLLAEGEILTLFAELGLAPPEELLDSAAFVNALSEGTTAAASLPDLISNLVAALEAEDFGEIAQTATAIVDATGTIVTQLESIAAELEDLAATLPGVDPADLTSFAGDLAEQLIEYLLITHLEGHYPVFLNFMRLFGVIELEEELGDPADPIKPPYIRRNLHLDQLPNLFNPARGLSEQYDWGENTFDAKLILGRLSDLFDALMLPVTPEPVDGVGLPSSLTFRWFTLRPKDDVVPPGLEFEFSAQLPAGIGLSIPINPNGWAAEFDLQLSAEVGTSIELLAPADLSLTPPVGSAEGDLSLAIVGTPPDPSKPFRLMEITGVGRIEISGVRAAFFAGFDWDSTANKAHSKLGFEARINRGKVIVAPDETDGFLSQLLPDAGINSDFEIVVGVDSNNGFYFEGSATLEVQLPTHISLGPVELVGTTIQILVGSDSIPVEVGTTLKAELGPLIATVEGLGLSADFTFPGGSNGNLGPANLDLGFKWPTGVGLTIDAEAVKGGGFLRIDIPNGRYVGMMQLEIQEVIDLTAIGLITTNLPDGKDGFSLLILISAEFQPIQLGLGFTLNGIGGLLGYNRTMVIDVLREGIRDNSLKSILFPEDPVANAMQIISDLRAAFPPHDGQFVIGPMAKIGYGTPSIITLEMGLVIELPDPIRIAILGVLKAILPEEESAIIKIQVNFLGTIDFEAGKLTFDASLFDSRLLVYDLSGDMAVRLFWKGEPQFLLSVGGFHPAFEPPPLDLPVLRRLALQLLKGDNPRLRLETYFAVSSNTVQFGAKLELYAAAGPFNVYGFLGFDALFQFSPFYFIADIGAMLALRAGSSTMASISLSLTLEGTTPWKAKGTAKLKLFWFLTVKVRFSTTWGENRNTLLEDVAVLDRLVEALQNKSNWQATLPGRSNLLVSLKEIAPIGDQVVVHPFGGLTISQKIVPLNVPIDKFGNAKPSDFNTFSITGHQAGGAPIHAGDIANTKDYFAPAQFFSKSDAQKLSADSFIKYDAGFALGTSEQLASSHYVKREVEYELKYIDSQRQVRFPIIAGLFAPIPILFNHFSKNRAVARSPLSHAARRRSALAPEAVQVSQEGYAVTNLSDLKIATGTTVLASEAEAFALMNQLQTEQPTLSGRLQVVPSFELNQDLAA